MNVILSINMIYDLYKPVPQTANNNFPSEMRFIEYPPSEILRPYIYSYYVCSSGNTILPDFEYRCVPDGLMDFSININKFEQLLINGTASQYRSGMIQFEKPVGIFGIRFYPGCFYQFFPITLREFADKTCTVREIWGNLLQEFEEKLFSAQSTRERINIANSFLIKQLSYKKREPDRRFIRILEQIYLKHGQISIENGDFNDISPRQLRRLFDQYIGISPKSFAKIVRLQSVLKTLINTPKQKRKDLYFNFGFYDQAHFIHEFKSYVGMTPVTIQQF